MYRIAGVALRRAEAMEHSAKRFLVFRLLRIQASP